MRWHLAVGLGMASVAALAPPAAAQTEAAVPEASRNVATAAQYRTALTDLSAIGTGSHTIRITADFTLNADNEPTYTGTRPLVILGQGHTIGGNDANRLVDHQSTARLTVRNLTFTDGESGVSESGGAVRALGPVTVANVTFTGGDAVQDGGALDVAGDLTVTGSTFTGNVAGFGNGGAIHVAGALSITDSRFDDNEAAGTDGGGAVHHEGTPAALTRVTFEGNSATDSDGGGAWLGADEVTVSDTSFVDNETLGTVGGHGGGLYIASGDVDTTIVRRTTFEDNGTTGANRSGGGLFVRYATIEDSTFDNNAVDGTGTSGGGLAGSAGNLVVRRSVFTSNATTGTASFGGAIAAEDLTLEDSTFRSNSSSGRGGALAVNFEASVSNSSFVTNGAVEGGAIFFDGSAEGLLTHATLVGNTGGNGTAVFSVHDVELSTRATVVHGLSADNCVIGAFATFTSLGDNADSGTSCGFTQASDTQNLASPGLGPLRDNGGPTPTLFPLAGSPLVDAIPSGDCALATDERGLDRPFGGGCDIGAVEQSYPDHPFTDVPGWVEDTVRWIGSTVNSPQIMTGITATTFEPDDPITRAQVTRLLYNEAGAPDVTSTPAHPFTDVPAWVDDAVTWAFDLDIVTGITPTTFVPDDPITRAQVTRMKYRFAGSPDVSGIDPHPFTDVPAWVDDAVRWAADTDNPLPLATGITPTTFVPNDPITRAQVARMDYRLALTPGAWDDPDAASHQMLFQSNLF